jgi:HlyD family secretion protein
MNIKKVASVVVCLGLLVSSIFFLSKLGLFKDDFVYAATVEATRVVIPARLPSQIIKFDVMAGDHIEKGQEIAKLDPTELQISLKQVNGKYERSLALYKNGHFPKSDLEVIQAEKEEIELKLRWCTVISTISGTVLAKYKECGEWVTQGTGLVSVADIRNVKAIFYIEHDKVAFVKVGDEVACYLPEMPGKTFCGKITVINSEPEFTPKNVQTRTERVRLVFGVRIDFINDEEILKPGMTVETQFEKFE